MSAPAPFTASRTPRANRRARTPRALALAFGAAVALTAPAARGESSVDARVADRRAIEAVLAQHRGSTGPSVSIDVLRDRVVDDLARSEAVGLFWGRPIATEQLRAEVERMATATRDPALLAELFAALGNDPRRIAETLARPALVDRVLRNAYGADPRFHDEARRRAEAALAGVRDAGALATLGADYAETTWVAPGGAARRRGENVAGSRDEWNALVARAASWFGAGSRPGERNRARPDRVIPIETISPLQETTDRFFAAAVLKKDDDRMTIATASWPKRTFDDWWSEARGPIVARVLTLDDAKADLDLGGDYGVLPEISGSSCVDGTWAPARAGQVPEERDSHTAVWTGTEMIVWGGAGVAGALDSGGRYTPATDTWTPTGRGTGVPSARFAHSAVWTGTEMIVWGGYSGLDDTNTGGRYNPASDSWTPTSTGANVPEIREGHTAVWTGTEMIVWGGDSIAIGPLGSGGRYNPSSDSWTAVASTGAPSARSLHTAVWTGTEMIVWGGFDGLAYMSTGARYAPATNQWTGVSTGAGTPSARGQHTAVWTGTEMIVWGGTTATGSVNTGARYKPSPEGWTPTSTGTGVPTARYVHTAVWTGTEMVVWGGFSGNAYVNTGARYRPSPESWTATSTDAGVPTGRGFHTAVWTGTDLIVWGGYSRDSADHQHDSGGRWAAASNTWLPTSSWADHRKWHTAVWTGAEMIVWGGEHVRPPAPASTLRTGGRYTPATDVWMATSVGTGVPSAREYHTAVWTGTWMIVWGGYNPPATEFATGARYDPASDTWSATATSGAPTARDTHTAIWTGSEMIVWGGWDGYDSFGTGGRYTPGTNAWTTMAAGPQDRYAHTAVWTGSEMIVWGGESISSMGTSTRLDTGSRYTPGSNAWTPIAVGPPPAPRMAHTAVWTGSEMIVWGGRDGVVHFDDGGRYRPSPEVWAAIAPGGGAPSPRSTHASVWTGSEMIVWGGSSSDGTSESFYDSGGRFAPATGLWTATTTAAAPSARDAHTAVWSGSEMIVWGGRDAASSLATGGRYCAAACATPAPTGSPALSLTDDNVTTTISWTTIASATAYDLVRGTLGSLRGSNGNFTASTEACLANDSATTSATDAALPAPGNGSWYLVRGVSCGGSGTYDSGAPRQSGSRDAEIAASPNACP